MRTLSRWLHNFDSVQKFTVSRNLQLTNGHNDHREKMNLERVQLTHNRAITTRMEWDGAVAALSHQHLPKPQVTGCGKLEL